GAVLLQCGRAGGAGGRPRGALIGGECARGGGAGAVAGGAAFPAGAAGNPGRPREFAIAAALREMKLDCGVNDPRARRQALWWSPRCSDLLSAATIGPIS